MKKETEMQKFKTDQQKEQKNSKRESGMKERERENTIKFTDGRWCNNF